MKIAVDFGHGTGQDRGAEGYINEEKLIREYGPLVIDGLRKLGHTVLDVTPKASNLTLGQSLAYRVNAANNYNADLFVSLHVNAFQKDKARGCEVEYISDKGKVYADRICAEISKLGFINRGSQLRSNLYVLKYTNMPAILIEPFFCDNKEDCSLYNPQELANAIIEGIAGIDIFKDVKKNENKAKTEPPELNHSIPQSAGIYTFPSGLGYIEIIPEKGRLDLHLDRYNYITIQDDEKEGNKVTVTTRTKGSKIIL